VNGFRASIRGRDRRLQAIADAGRSDEIHRTAADADFIPPGDTARNHRRSRPHHRRAMGNGFSHPTP
jgi:hypothetical protein